jgi:hypothetical protein
MMPPSAHGVLVISGSQPFDGPEAWAENVVRRSRA